MLALAVVFLTGVLAEGFLVVGLLATTFFADSLLTADFLPAGLLVVVEPALTDAERRATLDAVWVFVAGFALLVAFLDTGAFFTSFGELSFGELSLGDLAEVLEAARDFPATAAGALAGRLVVACLAANFFPVDLGPVDLAATPFLLADVRARLTGELFLVADFLGLKGCHPVNLGGILGMVGKTAKCVKLTIISLLKKRNSLLGAIRAIK